MLRPPRPSAATAASSRRRQAASRLLRFASPLRVTASRRYGEWQPTSLLTALAVRPRRSATMLEDINHLPISLSPRSGRSGAEERRSRLTAKLARGPREERGPRSYHHLDHLRRVVAENVDHLDRDGDAALALVDVRRAGQFERAVAAGAEALPLVLENVAPVHCGRSTMRPVASGRVTVRISCFA